MIAETCSCGASVNYPDHLGIEAVVDWRATHQHKPKDEPQPEKQGAGFASTQTTFLGQHARKEMIQTGVTE